jgi:hypothetical protein
MSEPFEGDGMKAEEIGLGEELFMFVDPIE